MIRTKLQAAAIAVALIFSSATGTMAHDEAKGPNGGQVADASGHHVEFVPSATEIAFLLTDESGKDIASEGAKATAIIQGAAGTETLQLTPAEPNKLVAKLVLPLAPGTKVVVSAVMADGHNIQARYVLP